MYIYIWVEREMRSRLGIWKQKCKPTWLVLNFLQRNARSVYLPVPISFVFPSRILVYSARMHHSLENRGLFEYLTWMLALHWRETLILAEVHSLSCLPHWGEDVDYCFNEGECIPSGVLSSILRSCMYPWPLISDGAQHRTNKPSVGPS